MVESRYAKQLSSVYYVVFIVLKVYEEHGYAVWWFVILKSSILRDVAYRQILILFWILINQIQ